MSESIGYWTCVVLAVILTAGCLAGPPIARWERANGFPFGQMCNSVFTGFVDTCPHRRPL